MAGYWCKLWLDILDDQKMYDLSDNAQLAFYQLLMIAKRLDDGGYLPSLKEIRFMTHNMKDEQWWIDAIKELMAGEHPIMVIRNGRYFMVNFKKRQKAADATERSKNFRKRQYEEEHFDDEDCNDPATEMQRKCNDSVMERDREINREKESRLTDREKDGSSLDSPISPEQLKAFQMALGELERSVSRADYDAWIKPIELVSAQGDTFTLRAINQFGADIVKTRYGPPMAKTIQGYLGRSVNLQIVI